jgi:hypothetical protein
LIAAAKSVILGDEKGGLLPVRKELLVYLCGLHSLGFAVFHAFFWRLFDWKSELRRVGRVNRGIFQILNLRLIYVFAFAAALCFLYPGELHATRLGRVFLLGGSLFWAGRLLEQFVFLRIDHPLVHLLTVLFALGAVLFALPLF